MAIWTACEKGDLERVRQLIQYGQDVNRVDIFNETTPLIVAANSGHNQVVQELIRAGADVNGINYIKRTALHRASCSGHSSVVKTLAEAGANLNVQDEDGRTPLMKAAADGHANVVVELIRAGADVNEKDKYKQTALHKASWRGHSSIVKTLAEAGANLNVQDKDGLTPLMKAAADGHANVMVELIRAGADVNGKDKYKRTALHKASWSGHSSVVKTLAEAGANLNVQDEDGWTPLMKAAADGHANVVVELIRAGADVNGKDKYKQTALHKASWRGHPSVVKTLAEAGANLNVQDEDEWTPLMKAAADGHANVVVELIRAGADVNGKGYYKPTALYKASCSGHFNVVKILAEAGANLNVQDVGGWTLLMKAAADGHTNVVVELIRAGADVNGKDIYKQTALHKASCSGHSSVVKTLAEAGANPNVQDEDGLTPLMKAAVDGHANVVVELIRAGADVNEKDKYKRTALHKATWRGHSSVVKALAEAGANLNVQDRFGKTPLMDAAVWADVVVELIRAGADVSVVSSRKWLSIAAGSTALHFAAERNTIECGVLLVEAGADMRTRNKNSKSPLDLASFRFRRTIQQAQSFPSKRIVPVIGNAEHGKSTLIAALRAEGNSPLKKVSSRLTRVQGIRKRTTGIKAVQFSSQKYGETLFYDFAGPLDYHGHHQSFLEAMLSRPGVSLSLLLLLKVTDEEDVITQQVTHWLQPLSLTSAPSTPQVILVGSFLDQVESREEATKKLLRCTRSVQEQFHFNIQGPCLLDCRKPASEGIDQICTLLQEAQPLQLNFIPFTYSLHWVLVQLRRSLSVPAITLHTFQSWLLKDAKLLLKNFPPAEQMCHDLTAVGHALFLPNKQDLTQSWLIVDLKAILHDVYGTLFSESRGKVNQFGLLHCSQLIKLFPKLEPAMIQAVLVGLEFCIQVDSSLLHKELLTLIPKDKGDNWLYFPALVSALPHKVFPSNPHSQHLQWACWQLRAAEKQFISAHLLQTIILRLAANHVFTHKLSPSVKEHCCSVWANGLSWMSTNGVDIAVQISNSSVIQVVGRSKRGPEKLHQYMLTIVRDVIETTAQLSPKLEATSYIVHPYTPAMWKGAKVPPPDSLYPVSSIIHSISDGGGCVLSRTREGGRLPHQISLAELFGGWSPPLSVVKDMDFKKEPQRGECMFPVCVCLREFLHLPHFSVWWVWKGSGVRA